MQRSLSSSSANYQHYNRLIPIEFVSNRKNDYYSSDSDSHNRMNIQRTSSTSSFSSSTSTNSANYRILPVRYSSVDRVLQKPAEVTSNKHGINVRIHFRRPHHHHHRHRQEHTEEYEHHRKSHMTKQEERYNSCPILNKNLFYTNSQRPSNIKYIETRSIVRVHSSDQLNKNTHSTTLIIRRPSLPPKIVPIRIKHIPLDTHSMFKPIISRVIREEEE